MQSLLFVGILAVFLNAVEPVKTAQAARDSYIGCFLDHTETTLNAKHFTSYYLTVEMCKMFCESSNAQFYGLKQGTSCFCGDLSIMDRRPEMECNEECGGNPHQFCGSDWMLSIYKNQNYDTGYLGCFTEQLHPILNGKHTSLRSMTIEKCKEICQEEDTHFYGLKDSITCYCGNFMTSKTKKPDGECNNTCSGNEKQFCGGKQMTSIYKNLNYKKGYMGCFLDHTQQTINAKHITLSGMTVEKCKTFCEERNAQFYGLKQGTYCFCGDLSLMDRRLEGECSVQCAGNQHQFCGANWLLSIYKNRKYDTGYLGCFLDQSNMLLNGKNTSSESMTLEKCKEVCQKEDAQFYGVKGSGACFCGNSLTNGTKKPDTECNNKCNGNKKQFCGGSQRISIYKDANYEKGYLGCFADHNKTTMNGKTFKSNGMKVELCKRFCEEWNAQFYGLKQGIHCFCGNVPLMDRMPEGECNAQCRGNQHQFCGGNWKISLYKKRNYDTGYLGCFSDQSDPILNGRKTSSESMTVEKCKDICEKEEVPFYGLQDSTTCVCGNSMASKTKKPDVECSNTCSGNEKEFCGGEGRISIYKNLNYEKGYLGCFQDQHQRILNGMFTLSHSMTLEKCEAFCKNIKYYGVENSNECFCGNTAQGVRKPEGECSDQCKGNHAQFCGGPWRISIYRNREYVEPKKKEDPSDSKECTQTADGRDYEGTWDKTESGRTCQSWSYQYPHKHKFPFLPKNYCRNPDGEPRPWCYTTDRRKRWEICGVPMCAKKKEVKDCLKTADGRDYDGKQSQTRSGRICQYWASQRPHRHKFPFLPRNYCRNPDGESAPWCYTIDRKKRWELCEIPMCGKTFFQALLCALEVQ